MNDQPTVQRKRKSLTFPEDITAAKRISELEATVYSLRKIIESAGDIIFTMDYHGYFTYVNQTGRLLTGYTDEELLEKNYIDLIHPRFKRKTLEFYLRQRADHVKQTYFECPLVKKDNSILWVGQSVIIIEEDGKIIGFEGVSRDITAERSTKAEIEKLTNAIHQSVDMMIITDHNGIIEFANEAFEKITGYHFDEVRGQSTRLLKSGYHDQNFYKEMWDRITRGETWRGVLKNRKKDGMIYDEEMTISPVRSEDGHIANFVAIKRDVTEKIRLEREQQEQYALLQAVLQSVEQGVEFDVDRKFKWVNDGMCRMFGYAREEMICQSTRMIYESDAIYETVGRELKKQFGEKGHYSAIVKARRKSGEAFECEIIGTPLDRNDLNKGWVGVLTDVTEEFRIRREQRERFALQQAVLQSVEQGVAFARERKFQWVNQSMSRMFGYSPEEMLGQSTLMIYASQDIYDNVCREKKQQLEEREYFSSIVTCKRKSGEIFECEIYDTPLNRNDFSEGFVGVFSDVTERKRNEEAREKITSLLQGIVDGSTHYSIVATDLTGTITLFNRGAEQLLGYGAEELVGKATLLRLHDKREINNYAQQIMEQEGVSVAGFDTLVHRATQKAFFEKEFTYVRKDASMVPVQLTVTSLRDSGGTVTGYLCIAKDITEERKTKNQIEKFITELQRSEESLRELNAQKDKFLSIVSHDLRSPFNSIMGFCEILLDPDQAVTAEESLEYISVIQSSAEMQLKLISNLLDWSRLETDRMPFEPKPIVLAHVVDGSFSSLRGIAQKKRIHLNNLISSAHQIEADENLVQQLFQNLISNALKFTHDGGEIIVSCIPTEKNFLEITMRDTGVGIPSESLSQLFRIDTKCYTHGTRGERGSGLGLVLCKEIVSKHGGTIHVESVVGVGTCFILTMPLTRQNKILIVDDVHGDRMLYRKFIEQLFPKLIVFEASNGYEGITLAMEHRPSLVILDYSMPVMDGLRFLQEMKRAKELENVPVIVITGVDSSPGKEALEMAGATVIIDKPITKNVFEELIVTYLDAYR